MKNWKIGTRIAAGFAAVIVIAMALGIFAYTKVGGIETSSHEVTTRVLPKVYLVGQIQKNVELAFALAVQHAATGDKQLKSELDAEIQNLQATNSGIVAEYEKLISTQKGRELHEVFKTARATFWASLGEMLKVSRTGTAEADRRAVEMAIQMRPQQKKYAEAAENIVVFNKSLADEAGDTIEASVASTRVGV